MMLIKHTIKIVCQSNVDNGVYLSNSIGPTIPRQGLQVLNGPSQEEIELQRR